MFKWKKLGKIFDPHEIRGIPWMKEFAQAPSVLLFDTFVRVYFSCRPLPDKHGKYLSYAGFVDLDKKNIHTIVNISRDPILPLGKRGTFDEFGIYPISVIRNDNEVRAYYGGWTRCETVPFNVAIGYAKSYDGGKTFLRTGTGPVLSYTSDEPFILSSPKIRKYGNQWYLWYTAGKKWITVDDKPEPVYKIRMARSHDGIQWEKMNKDLIESKIEKNEAQASPDVFYYNNLFHMFFSYRRSTNFRCKEGGYRIGYAFSKDIINWTRADDEAGIDVSRNEWDSEMIAYPHVFELHDTVYMLYLGNQVGKYGFGVARLENDSLQKNCL